MYLDDPTFKRPSDDTTIWRYLDFTKFVSLIDSQALFFSNVGRLEDDFEGAFPEANDDFSCRVDLSQERQEQAAMSFREYRKQARHFRNIVYVNCWQMSPVESVAMWKQYLKSDEGVAIQSTYGRLKSSLQSTHKILIGSVQYIDFATDRIPVDYGVTLFDSFLYKRLHFQHEHELRAMWADFGQLPLTEPGVLAIDALPDAKPMAGELVPVALGTLIDKVVMAPRSPDWFIGLVESVILKYGGKKEVIRSSLDNAPSWGDARIG